MPSNHSSFGAKTNLMDTKHLVDPELRPLLDQYADQAVNAQTLGALRQVMIEAVPADDGAGDGLAVKVERRSVPRLNEPGTVGIVIVRPNADKQNRGGILHLHTGGMVMGSPDSVLPLLRQEAAQLDCVIVSVDYRLAPEAVFPAAIEDCYSALCWMAGEAGSLGVDPARIGVAGESAGGGLAAALTLLTRDRSGPKLAFQNLLCPMLDDRTGSGGDSNSVTGQFVWKREDNRFGWTSLLGEAPGLLGEAPGGGDVSPYAAPARATNLAGLPPAYIAVGSIDLLLDEDVAYAMRLIRAGVPVELTVHPGAFHGFDFIAADAAVSQRAFQQRLDAFSRALLPPINVSDTR